MQTTVVPRVDAHEQTELLREILVRLQALEASQRTRDDIVRQVPAMLGIAVDSFDEIAQKADVNRLVEVLQESGEALAEASRAPALKNSLGLLRAMRDPDTRRGLQFVLDSMKVIGSLINEQNGERK